MPPRARADHDIRPAAKIVLGAALTLAVLARAVGVVAALSRSDEAPLLAFPLAVIFPALLAVALGAFPPASSREGALMRVGTAVQCIGIVAWPGMSLRLALGLPVVFLVVELFETRCPAPLRDAIARRIVA